MPRYKNEDNVLAMINRFYNMCETRAQRTLVLDMKQAFLEIHTADVAPRSEVEEWYHEYHRIKDELKQEREYHRSTEKLADRYMVELQTAKTEVEELKAENERLVDLVKELQEYNEAWVEDNGKLRNENKNLAREIFKEIGKRMVCTNEEDFRVFVELKKKYTEGDDPK